MVNADATAATIREGNWLEKHKNNQQKGGEEDGKMEAIKVEFMGRVIYERSIFVGQNISFNVRKKRAALAAAGAAAAT